MGKPQFLMETLGHCVICLDHATTTSGGAAKKVLAGETNSQPLESRSQSKIISFQNICKYLKTNMKDVFEKSPPTSSPIISSADLQSSELKGTLCPDCATHLDRFSNLYLELEEIKLKLQHSLQPISAKLALRMDEGDPVLEDFKGQMMRRPNNSSSQYGIVQRWRKQTLEGCTRILTAGQPRVEVTELSEANVQFHLAKQAQAPTSSPPSPISEDFTTAIKVEDPVEEEDQTAAIKLDPDPDGEIAAIKLEPDGDNYSDSLDPLDEDYNPGQSPASSAESEEAEEKVMGGDKQVNRKTRSAKSADPRNVKCSHCDKILANGAALKIHFRDCHLKFMHNCSSCGKGFLYRSSLNRHQRFSCAKSTTQEPQPLVNEADEDDDHSKPDFILPDAVPEVQHGHRDNYIVILEDTKDAPDPRSTIDPENYRHKCSICSKDYPTLKHVQDHFNSAHRIKRFQCKLCLKVLSRMTSFYIHFKGVHGPRKFSCQVCLKRFRDRTHLRRHTLSTRCAAEEQAFRYKCLPCSKEFYNRAACYRHRQRNHGKGTARFKCHVCQAIFNREGDLREHREAAHSKRKWKCSGCPRLFSNVKSKMLHRRMLHCRGMMNSKLASASGSAPQSIMRIKCDEDPKTEAAQSSPDSDNGSSKTKSATAKNTSEELPPIIINPKNGKVICEPCSKEYSDKNAFKKHYKTAHLKLKVLCPECGEQFTRQGGLDIHRRNFHMGVKFICTVCSQEFSQKSGLTRHLRKAACGKVKVPDPKKASVKVESESGEEDGEDLPGPSTSSRKERSTFDSKSGKRECSICKQKFASLDSFQDHYQNVHLERRYSCKSCDKTFTNRGGHARHVRRVHLGVVDHKCDICHQGFSSKAYLNKHKDKNCKSGRALKPPLKYVCSHPGCTREFDRSANMLRHLTAVHGKVIKKKSK